MKEQFSGHGIEEASSSVACGRAGGRAERTNLNTAVTVPDWGQPVSPPALSCSEWTP